MTGKKRGLFILGIIILLVLPFASAGTITGNAVVEPVNGDDLKDIDKYESLSIMLSVTGEVELSQPGKLTATLSLFPETDSRQDVLKLSKVAEPVTSVSQQDGKLVYSWSSASKVIFGIESEINTQVVFPGSEKISFPFEVKENIEYTKASENIDITNDIKQKANEIVAGKTDALETLAALADYVNQNIIYDENYKDSVKKASYVLENRRGVCDEFTNLFIAFCRSLGIPARYISGVAYSNVKNEFGNHAWAEVYVPGHGWIPFDATYGQYGWIDSTHIALSKTIDTETSVLYQYPSNAQAEAKKLSIKAVILKKGNLFEPKESMEIELLKNNINEKSYTPLEVKIKNNQNHYLPIVVYATKAPGIYGKNSKSFLLKPLQEKKVFFIITTQQDIEEGYRYTGAIEIKTSYNSAANTAIEFSKNYDMGFGLSEALDLIDKLSVKEEEFAYDAEIDCAGTQQEFYEDENVEAKCIISNKGNVLLKGLKFCVAEDCRTFDLAIGDKKEEQFSLGKDKKDYIVTLSNDVVSKTSYLGIALLKNPSLKILGIEPLALDYGNNNLTLTVETQSKCKNAEISLNSAMLKKEDIALKEKISFNFAGSSALGEKVKVKASCEDLHGRLYEDSKTFDVKINNVPIYGKILQFFYKLLGM